MKITSEYVSNTIAAGGNQYIFEENGQDICKGRVFYRLSQPGSFDYRISYSGVIDSTFADGSISKCNLQCSDWKLLECKVTLCKQGSFPADFMDIAAAQKLNKSLFEFQSVSFSGKEEALIHGTEAVISDPFLFCAEAGDYLCIETQFQGTWLPYHEESLLPIYRFSSGNWQYDKRVPLPEIIACKKSIKARIGFWGDSITQGIGTEPNSYRHWCALLEEKLPREFACWNLGLGYARASDAASMGAWMKKALQNDVLCVCFGVNDILQGASSDTLKQNLRAIVSTLKSHGKTVLLQTVPPFDYSEDRKAVWMDVNHYIRTELSTVADAVFDNVPLLGQVGAESHIARFGGHPNEEGCALWAEAILNPVLYTLHLGGYL